MTTYNVESRYKEPLVPWVGGYFEYTDPATTTLVVDCLDGYLRVLVQDLTTIHRRQYVLSSDDLECDPNVAGPGGLHPNYAIAINTTYDVYVAWSSISAKRDGTVCLFAVPSGTAITTVLMGQLSILDYDLWSPEPIASISTDGAGAIIPFEPVYPVPEPSLEMREFTIHITALSDAGQFTLATVTGQRCRILDVNIESNGATTANLTSARIVAGTGNAREWIDAVAGARAFLIAEDYEVAAHPSSVLDVGKTIDMILAGPGSTAVDFTVTIRYSPTVYGGFLQ